LRQRYFQMSKLYFLAILFTVSFCNFIYAQPQKGEFIHVSAGLGISSPLYEDQNEVAGTGFYAQGEYVWSPLSWFGVRPYVGVLIASDELKEEGIPNYKIKSNAALLGVKVRLAVPIPYAAPFIESGVGVSIGSFHTYTAETNLKKNGLLFHIPVTLGLALGRNHEYEFKFIYYFNESVEQFSGAAAIGFTIPINEE
jgi:hypothetical protein